MDERLVLLGYALVIFGLLYLGILILLILHILFKHLDTFENRESCNESIKAIGIMALVPLYAGYEILGRHYMFFQKETSSISIQIFQYIGIVTMIYIFLWFLSTFCCKNYKLSS